MKRGEAERVRPKPLQPLRLTQAAAEMILKPYEDFFKPKGAK